MTQTVARSVAASRASGPIVSPLLISDRLISLAEQAGEAGCTDTARHLIRLALRVLDEKRPSTPSRRARLS